MAKKATGKGEAPEGSIIYSHEDKVKFKVAYPKNWPDNKPKHMKDGDVLEISEAHAKTLVEKGIGTITEYLNEKRDKSLDKKNLHGEDSKPKVTTAAAVKAGDKQADTKAPDTKKDEKKDPE